MKIKSFKIALLLTILGFILSLMVAIIATVITKELNLKSSVNIELFWGAVYICLALLCFTVFISMQKNYFQFIPIDQKSILPRLIGLTAALLLFSFFDQFSPSISDLNKHTEKVLNNTVLNLEKDTNFLLNSGKYDSLSSDNFKDFLEKDNMTFKFKPSNELEKNIELALDTNNNLVSKYSNFSLSGLQHRIKNNIPEQDNFIDNEKRGIGTSDASGTGGGSGEKHDIPFPDNEKNKVLAFFSVDKKDMDRRDGKTEYKSLGFKAKIDGGLEGECYNLFITQYSAFYENVGLDNINDLKTLRRDKSQKICIKEDPNTFYENYLSLKIDLELNFSLAYIWITSADAEPLTTEVNKTQNRKLDITDMEIIMMGTSFHPDFPRWNTDENFCIEGFHKGTPDRFLHKVRNNESIQSGKCPLEYR